MQKVIGLDIGSYSIKATEFVNTFKTYEITNFYETEIPHIDEVPMEAIAPACMEQMFQENHLQADRIVTAMPGQFISSRILDFKFSDPRKIQAAVAAEVEDYVPFNMDDMIIDHQILGEMGGSTLVLAVMTRKAFLKNFLDLLGRIDIDPKLVDIDSLAFYNLSTHIEMDPSECYAMIDVGHEKTSICIVRDGLIRMFRSINLGGRYITDFLARDLETSFQEAQRIKHQVSRVFCGSDLGDGLSGDERMVVERTTLAANSILKELGRTFYAFKNWDKYPISRLYLTGGTAKTANFAEFTEEQLEVPTELFKSRKTDLRFEFDPTDRETVMAQSLAIGLRTVSTVKRHSTINLRRGEFAYVQNYENLLKGAATAFKIVAVLMALLVISYTAKHIFYTGQIDKLRAQYKKEFTAEFPDSKGKLSKKGLSFAELRAEATSQLNLSIATKQAALNAFRRSMAGSPALRILREISESIPKDVLIDVTLFDYKPTIEGEGRFELKAETDNFASQAKIIDALKGTRLLTDVQEKSSGAKPGTSDKIEFTITATFREPGEG